MLSLASFLSFSWYFRIIYLERFSRAIRVASQRGLSFAYLYGKLDTFGAQYGRFAMGLDKLSKSPESSVPLNVPPLFGGTL